MSRGRTTRGAPTQPLAIGKASLRSRIHRRADMHYVGVKTYRPDGTVAGEILVLGLFTSQAYTRAARDIPLLRHKTLFAGRRYGFDRRLGRRSRPRCWRPG